jgi:flagellar hook-length control protein FliK
MSAANGAIGTSGLEVTASVNAASGSGASAAGAAGAFDAAPSSLPGSGVASAITPQAIGGSLRVDANAAATVQSPVTADQLPVALDQTAIDLARLRGGMLTLELAPADLGRLSFEMRIDDSGAAFVAIRLADDTVRALVENAAGALRDSLSREGFKLDSFTVSSGFGSPEQRENSQNQAFAETSNRRVQSSGSSTSPRESVQSRVSNTQVRPGTSSLSLFA